MARGDGDMGAKTKRAPGALNPYAAPGETTAHDFPRSSDAEPRRFATINQRFAAHFVDILVFILPPFALSVNLGADALALDGTGTRFLAVVGVAALVPALVQWFLIANYGQTIGKRLFKTRIVRVDGSPAGFLHGVVLRSWVGCLPALVPFAGYAYVIVDSFYVFRRDRRTLRDRVAGTCVVRA